MPYAPLSHIKFRGRSGSLATLKVPDTRLISSPSTGSSFATVPVLDSSSSLCQSPYSEPSSSSSPSASSSSSALYPPPRHLTLLCHLTRLNVKLRTFPPSSEELDQLFSSLSQCSTKPVILALVRGYSSRYVPNSLSLDMPSPLSDLYKAEYLSSSYYELLQVAQATEVSVTPAQALAVEEKTRSQCQSRLCHRMRSGRVTASRLKAVCCTDQAYPSMSLVMSIFHPKLSQFRSTATTWGCKHESEARAKYKILYEPLHQQFSISDC